MESETNKKIVCRYFREVWNRGDLDAAGDIVAADFSGRGAGSMSGLDALKLYVKSYRELFPDLKFTILSMCEAAGDKVTVCWARSSGRQAHPEDGVCSAEHGVVTGLSVYRIENGKIREAWLAPSASEAMQKLGLQDRD